MADAVAPRTRILIADDDATLRYGLAVQLERWGYDPVVCEDGLAARHVLGAEVAVVEVVSVAVRMRHRTVRTGRPAPHLRLEPATLTVREPSLDDVFLTLTGRHAEPSGTEGGAA